MSDIRQEIFHGGYPEWSGNEGTEEQGGDKMNTFILEHVRLTKDAVLVERYFGTDLCSPLARLTWKNRIDELVTEARRLDKEAKKEQ